MLIHIVAKPVINDLINATDATDADTTDATDATDAIVDRPTQLICISDIYLLSWRW